MSEPFLAEIRIVGFNFAPRGWAFCDGQILPINQNQSLYSLLGTTYGGDGRTDGRAEAEGENWVWSEVTCLESDYRHCMIGLSRGCADATVVREFDTVAKKFVKDGFVLPEAKHQIDWMDENTLWVATDFGEGSLTSSGYPRIAKEWRRGTPLESAATV